MVLLTGFCCPKSPGKSKETGVEKTTGLYSNWLGVHFELWIKCDFDAGHEPTTLCAIQAAVGRLLQGLSRMVLREMRHRVAQASLPAGLFWLGGLQI